MALKPYYEDSAVRLYHGDCRDILPTLEAVDHVITDHADDLQIGTAAEHLVCADLLLAGYRAFRADQHCPYDVAVEHKGRVIRIQVKATRKPRALPQRRMQTSAYLFQVRRSGKRGMRRYRDDEFDVLALVALDIRKIAYMRLKDAAQSVHLRIPGVQYDNLRKGPGRQFEDLGFAACL